MKNKTVICENCGKIWKLVRIKLPHGTRDADSLNCKCGHEIINWNGAHVYSVEDS